MKLTTLGFLKDQFTAAPTVEHTDLSGKTVVLVGANTGLGFEATKHFATMRPAKLILACRSRERGEDALKRIESETGYKAELRILDLAVFGSVSSFADAFIKENDRLDILVLNAALITPDYVETSDNWEACLQVNNISSPLVILRLLPLMLRTAAEHKTTPRIVIVASEVHYWAEVEDVINTSKPLEKLSNKDYCTPQRLGNKRYLVTKFLNVLFTRALSERTLKSSVTAVAINPGLCTSELRRNVVDGSIIMRWVEWTVINAISFTAEQGSRQIVYGAIGGRKDEAALKGQYISKSQVRESSDFVLSEEGKRVQYNYWNELLTVLGNVDGQIPGIVKDYLS